VPRGAKRSAFHGPTAALTVSARRVLNAPTTRKRYITRRPAAPLRQFVECLWVHSIDGADPAEDLRILPDGRIDFVWIRELGTLVAGPQSRHTRRPAAAPLLAVGARFHPGVAPALLGLPASAMVDRNLPLEAVRPALAARLEDRLAAARDPLGALEQELVRSVEGLAEPDPVVRAATAPLAEGRTGVAGVADRVHMSERALQRRFAERVGYGPKTFQRIARFQRALGQLGRGGAGLARVGAVAGYADQAHLARESRRLAGLTPRELVSWIG
jgi:AraC-like DNA-binding protein